MDTVLNLLIPAVVLGYAAWLIVRAIRQRGFGCGGCAGCHMADGCTRKHQRKEERPNE